MGSILYHKVIGFTKRIVAKDCPHATLVQITFK